MDYSLSSSRKIGKYLQKIVTIQNNANRATATNNVLAKMQDWHERFEDLDVSGREVGTINYGTFMELESPNEGTGATYADVTFTAISLSTGKPKMVTTTVNNVTNDTATTNIIIALNNALSRLTGEDFTSSNNYLISATLLLH